MASNQRRSGAFIPPATLPDLARGEFQASLPTGRLPLAEKDEDEGKLGNNRRVYTVREKQLRANPANGSLLIFDDALHDSYPEYR
jgi:hypothetical protein